MKISAGIRDRQLSEIRGHNVTPPRWGYKVGEEKKHFGISDLSTVGRLSP